MQEGIGSFYSGPCAFFMPSGILADADAKAIEDVIGLFVEENVEGFKAMIAGMGSATPEAA